MWGKRKRLTVVLVGSRAAGKTTLLAGLEALNVPDRPSRLQLHAAPATRERLKRLAGALRMGEWPPPTTRYEPYAIEVHVHAAGRPGTTVLRMDALDYDGELAKELESADNESVAELRDTIARADVLVLVLDPDTDVTAGDDAPAARQDRAERQLAVIAAVEQVWRVRHPEGRRVREMPHVAVVLTKADRHPELACRKEAEAFVDTHLPGLLSKVTARGAKAAAFPISAVGAVRRGPDGVFVPSPPLAPRGYDELFDWVVGVVVAEWNRGRRNAAIRIGAIALAAVLLLGGTAVWWKKHQKDIAIAILDSPTMSPGDIITKVPDSDDEDIRRKRAEVIERAVVEIEQGIGSAGSEEKLAELRSRISALKAAPLPPQFQSAPAELNKKLGARERVVRRSAIDQAILGDRKAPGVLVLISKYLTDFPGAEDEKEMRAEYLKIENEHWDQSKLRLKQMSVVDGRTVREKAAAFRDYLKRWDSKHQPGEVERMKSAITLADFIATRRAYKLEVIESGTFATTRWHIVRVIHHPDGSDAPEKQVQAHETEGRKTIKRWGSDVSVPVSWECGDPVRVELWVYHRTSGELRAAHWSGAGSLQLLNLDGVLNLTADPGWESAFEGTPRIAFRLPEVSAQQVLDLRSYIVPGGDW